MPRRNSAKSSAGTSGRSRRCYPSEPWRCEHRRDGSEIQAFVEASGIWETVAVIPPTSGVSARNIAEFIAALVNDNRRCQSALEAAMEALQHVIDDNGLTFSSEHAVDSALTRLKQIGT